MNGKVEIKQFLSFVKHKQQDTLGIYTLEEFRAVLKHERARADRDGSDFSLVVFEVGGVNGNIIDTGGMVRALGERIRSIDEIGWIDEKSIGVLLPSTNLEGGWIFAVDFEKNYSAKQLLPPFTVYSYPRQWYENGGGKHYPRSSMSSKPQHVNSSFNQRSKIDTGKFAFTKAQTEQDSRQVKEVLKSILAKKLPVWKRVMDIVGSIAGIILFSPLLLLTCVYIKIVSPGPVLFKQKRVGYKGELFTFLKFRTMKIDNDHGEHKNHLKSLINSDVPMEKLDSGRDPRIIPGGKVIRKACLDEFPQLINVLRGEMSLVGPRPCIPYEAQEYLCWHTHRFDIVPGITGLWQVSGKNKLTFKQMIRLDISYANNMSIWLDLKILLLTGPVVIGLVLEAVLKRLREKRMAESQAVLANPMTICQALEIFAEKL